MWRGRWYWHGTFATARRTFLRTMQSGEGETPREAMRCCTGPVRIRYNYIELVKWVTMSYSASSPRPCEEQQTKMNSAPVAPEMLAYNMYIADTEVSVFYIKNGNLQILGIKTMLDGRFLYKTRTKELDEQIVKLIELEATEQRDDGMPATAPPPS